MNCEYPCAECERNNPKSGSCFRTCIRFKMWFREKWAEVGGSVSDNVENNIGMAGRPKKGFIFVYTVLNRANGKEICRGTLKEVSTRMQISPKAFRSLMYRSRFGTGKMIFLRSVEQIEN